MKRFLSNIVCTLSFALMLALVFGSCKPLLEGSLKDQVVAMNAPQENDTLASGFVGFWWNELENASGYRIQIAKPDFANPSQLLVDTLVTSYTFSFQLTEGAYEWRVRAENSNSETQYVYRNFYVKDDIDLTGQTVVLKSPIAGYASRDSAFTFTWFALPTADKYTFRLEDSIQGVVVEQFVYTDSFSVVLQTEGTYTWKVKAKNATSETDFTSRSFYYDKIAPAAPLLLLPVFGDTVNIPPTTLSWTRPDASGSPITDSVFVFTDSLVTSFGVYTSSTESRSVSLPPDLYYWRVRSVDNAGNASDYSSTFKFWVE